MFDYCNWSRGESHTNFRSKAPPGLNFNSHRVFLVMNAECPVVETSYCSLTRDDWWCVFPSLFVPRIIEASPSSPRFSLEDSMRICPLSGIGGGLVHIARMRLKVWDSVLGCTSMSLLNVWMSDHFCVGFSWVCTAPQNLKQNGRQRHNFFTLDNAAAIFRACAVSFDICVLHSCPLAVCSLCAILSHGLSTCVIDLPHDFCVRVCVFCATVRDCVCHIIISVFAPLCCIH